MTVRVLSWNVLAAPWASAEWYPDGMDAEVLDRATRIERIADQIVAAAADVVCLQEATEVELAHLVESSNFACHFASMDEHFWLNWLGADSTWEPNGTAVLWDHRRFDAAARGTESLGEHGNVATWVDLRDRASNVQVRIVSLHLDSDDPDRRRAEIPALLAACFGVPIVVIAGDYNEDTVTSGSDRPRIGDAFFDEGFVDVFEQLDRRAPTHPYARPGDSWEMLATIDHVLVRGLTAIDARVIDAGVWSIDGPHARMEECLRSTGSDHLALVVELDLEREVALDAN